MYELLDLQNHSLLWVENKKVRKNIAMLDVSIDRLSEYRIGYIRLSIILQWIAPPTLRNLKHPIGSMGCILELFNGLL